MDSRTVLRFASVGAFVATVPIANWMVQRFGVWPVGFGLHAPAGVYMAGATLALRDIVQWAFGKRTALAAMLLGLIASWVVAGSGLALASCAAFALAESLEFFTYTRLQKRPALAVGVSGALSAAADSAVFLSVAFGSLAFFDGQMVGKLYAVIIGAILAKMGRKLIA